jgi:hypothetical protein
MPRAYAIWLNLVIAIRAPSPNGFRTPAALVFATTARVDSQVAASGSLRLRQGLCLLLKGIKMARQVCGALP